MSESTKATFPQAVDELMAQGGHDSIFDDEPTLSPTGDTAIGRAAGDTVIAESKQAEGLPSAEQLAEFAVSLSHELRQKGAVNNLRDDAATVLVAVKRLFHPVAKAAHVSPV
ncbi:MAG: hypothetical protein WCG83_01280 [Candidatus Peregrinibacteria bacterium]